MQVPSETMNFGRICVFCGSNLGSNPLYRAAAEQLAGALVLRGIDLVYGGGNIRLMGVLADAVLAGGGKVIGVSIGIEWATVGRQRLPEMFHVIANHSRSIPVIRPRSGQHI